MRRLAFAVLVVLGTLPGSSAVAGPTDSIAIVEPEHHAYFPDVPSLVTVVVESKNASALTFEHVGLEVDGAEVPDQGCDGPGTCTFEVLLDEGEHTLRAQATRDLGPQLGSDPVTVQIGGEPPMPPSDDTTSGGTTSDATTETPDADATTAGDATTDPDDTATPSDDGGPGSTGTATSAADDTSGASEDAAADGCTCAARGHRAPTALAAFVLLAAVGRRRRDAVRASARAV